jgi:citrate synthase
MDGGANSQAQLAHAVRAEIKALVDAGTRYVPGFGHRFHPRDPRAPRLLALVEAAAAAGAVVLLLS